MKYEALCKSIKAPIHEALCILSPQYATANPRMKGVNSATTRIQSERTRLLESDCAPSQISALLRFCADNYKRISGYAESNLRF